MANAFFFNLLVSSIRRLADSADNQISYIDSLKIAPLADEIALEFDDGFRLLGVFISEGYISQETAQKIRNLDAKLESIGGKEIYWEYEALRNSIEWREIRILAQEASDAIGNPIEIQDTNNDNGTDFDADVQKSKKKITTSVIFLFAGIFVYIGNIIYWEHAPRKDEFSEMGIFVIFFCFTIAAALIQIINCIMCTLFLVRKIQYTKTCVSVLLFSLIFLMYLIISYFIQ